MQAMLVCAGLGTRLAPLTDWLPKPAVPVANRPLAWFALDHLQRAGCQQFVVNTHHLAERLRAELQAHAPASIQLRFVHEPVLLGTGGGIKNAWRDTRDQPLLTMNGKLLFAPDIAAAQQLHEQTNAIATMVLKPMPSGDAFSAIEIDNEGRVRRMLDEPAATSAPLQRMMYTGVQILAPRAFQDLPDHGCIIRNAYRHWLARGERIMATVDPATFRDAGISPKHYWQANQALLNGTEPWPNISPNSSQNLIAPTAQVASSARLTQTAVGAHAAISPNTNLQRCVIWPNAKVDRDLIDAIVLPNGTQISVA